MLYIQTLQDCLKKLESYSKILFHTFILLCFSYLKFKRSLPEKLGQVFKLKKKKKIQKDKNTVYTASLKEHLATSSQAAALILTKESLSQIHAH